MSFGDFYVFEAELGQKGGGEGEGKGEGEGEGEEEGNYGW